MTKKPHLSSVIFDCEKFECSAIEVKYKNKKIDTVPNHTVIKSIKQVVNLCQSLIYVPCDVANNFPDKIGRTLAPPSLRKGL